MDIYNYNKLNENEKDDVINRLTEEDYLRLLIVTKDNKRFFNYVENNKVNLKIKNDVLMSLAIEHLNEDMINYLYEKGLKINFRDYDFIFDYCNDINPTILENIINKTDLNYIDVINKMSLKNINYDTENYIEYFKIIIMNKKFKIPDEIIEDIKNMKNLELYEYIQKNQLYEVLNKNTTENKLQKSANKI